ncbi:MAG: RNA-binding transcriptional accessory protein [Acidobacteria bacterium]|nr:RNA-binding transcriptional accessory protein [Acidobacteriota bacterium]
MTDELSQLTNSTEQEKKQFHLLALTHLIEEQKANHSLRQIHGLIGLLEEGATVPFIARYRKEITGGMDEVIVSNLKDRFEELCELEVRKKSILETIEKQGKLTPELEQQINACHDKYLLEDLYLPYKPKRKTKASVAREKGLEPLAMEIFATHGKALEKDLKTLASSYINSELGVNTSEEALEGASHIIAEWISETVDIRTGLRNHLSSSGDVVVTRASKEKTAEPTKYEMYYDFREKASKIPSHRYLAVRRGEEEGVLKYTIEGDRIQMVSMLDEHFLTHRSGETAEFLRACLIDALDRLLQPSLITEVRLDLKRRAETEAIAVFAQNLRQVLLSPPAGERRVLGLDPGYRTGCKIAVIDETGKLLAHSTIYPHQPQNRVEESKQTLINLCKEYHISAIAVGNGTASRETMQIAQEIGATLGISTILVNESGASIYSASEIARAEFPDLDLTLRSAASIARRFQDPLAELVKIDPKSIGVGQYQHDVDQGALKKSLDSVVESCVNYVGIDLNTASETLLKYVSGIGPAVAKEIVLYRNEKGRFSSRKQLLDVAKIGPKTFEQSAGFLRIRDGINSLDNTGVHPESYLVVEKMAVQLNVTVNELIGNENLLKKVDLNAFITEQVGLLTLNDIMGELSKPGRDPRSEFAAITFTEGITSLDDLEVDMILDGVVTNVTNFGAFVDIGVHQDGLVHVSHLSHRYIKSPTDVVKVGDKVKVKVLEVDMARRRISLSIKDTQPAPVKTFERSSKPAQKGQQEKTNREELQEKQEIKVRTTEIKSVEKPAQDVQQNKSKKIVERPKEKPADTTSLADKLAAAWAKNRLK